MKFDKARLKSFVERNWIPLLAFAALFIVCSDSNPHNHRYLAKLFSGTFYKVYIGASVLVLVALAIHRRKMQTIFWGLELTLSCLVITNVLKFLVPLGRPPRMKDGIIAIGGFSPGFPSAHTAFAFGLAWLVYVLKPRYSPLWFAVAVAVGWSRLEMRSHYAYQVVCGAILGVILAHFISGSIKGITQNTFRRFQEMRKKPQTQESAAHKLAIQGSTSQVSNIEQPSAKTPIRDSVVTVAVMLQSLIPVSLAL